MDNDKFCLTNFRFTDEEKKYWNDIFWDNLHCGQWQHSCPKLRKMYWWTILFRNKENEHLMELFRPVQERLNLSDMNVFPWLSYQFANSQLPHHQDGDKTGEAGQGKITTVNINLMIDHKPIIHIEHEPYEYESAVVNIANYFHGVEPVDHDRLILKIMLRETYEDVYNRLSEIGLID